MARGSSPTLPRTPRTGPIPRIAADGRTPFGTYSKPRRRSRRTGLTKIAIVVTGLGLNEQGTLDAVDRLPPEVTLAFAPYGRTLDRTTGAARADGHELFLEVPLEPFDYPDNDPGPETLLTGQPPRANLEKFYWLLGRFGGYAGLINYMGARFTASAADFAPVMEEVSARGLGYLDDGSSNRSLAAQLAAVEYGALWTRRPDARRQSVARRDPCRGSPISRRRRSQATARSASSRRCRCRSRPSPSGRRGSRRAAMFWCRPRR